MSTATNLINQSSDASLAESKPTHPRGTGENAVVRAEHLGKGFGDLLAVDNLTFTLERGTVTGFLGPNEAGKTTTVRAVFETDCQAANESHGRRCTREAARTSRCEVK